MKSHYDPSRPHHHPDGFQNIHTEFAAKGLGKVLRGSEMLCAMGGPCRETQQVIVEKAEKIHLDLGAKR